MSCTQNILHCHKTILRAVQENWKKNSGEKYSKPQDLSFKIK